MSRTHHGWRLTRRNVHALFAVVSLLLLTLCAVLAWQWLASERLTAAVRAVPAEAGAADVDVSPQGAIAGRILDAPAPVRLAWANALSQGGELALAESLYVALAGDATVSRLVALAARYNLANAYLRQGSRESLAGSERRAMLELAKQRYRDVLAVQPSHRAARYNLERALRLAPEQAFRADGDDEPVKRVNVVVPDFRLKDLP